jgi:S1-C subfamily serine protease
VQQVAVSSWVVDLVILAAVGVGIFTGYRRGALIQIFSWGGFVVGIVIGGLLAPPIIRAAIPNAGQTARAIVALVTFLLIAFLTEAVIAIAGGKLVRKITAAGIRRVDAIGGSVVAAFMVLLLAWLLSAPAASVPGLARAVKQSAVLRIENKVLPDPPKILAVLGSLLSRTGFPQVFEALNPHLAPGVAPPPPSLAHEKGVLDAAKITYKIEGVGCGGRVDGTGFPVGDGTVITAAHVVAGTRGTKIIPAAGKVSYDATVVYMDTRRDIAVLHSPTLPRATLTVDPDPAGRGTDGAAIGYPGGGKRTITPARVRTRVDAIGKDIYARNRVTREIYVLRAEVHQGNSGGPFVDTRGRVRGMIFAASSTEKDESYALTETEITRAEHAATGKSRQINTGDCAL